MAKYVENNGGGAKIMRKLCVILRNREKSEGNPRMEKTDDIADTILCFGGK